MATTADFKNGLCINFNGDVWQIVEFQHVKPGKGNAFVRTRLKNLKNGKVLANTFPAGVKIDTARIPEFLINNPQFLKEGCTADILVHAETEEPLSCELPAYMDFEITYTEPGEKGNTATNAMKDATIDTGATIRVPLFVNTGDKVRVDTRNGEYSQRV